MSDLLLRTFRDSDVVARLGGDEFVVLLIDARDAGRVSARLDDALQERNAQTTTGYEIKCSTGIVRFAPQRHTSIDDLLREADAKMYEAKRRGRSP